MINKITKNGLTWYEFNLTNYCFIAFSVKQLIKEIPKEYRNIVLINQN